MVLFALDGVIEATPLDAGQDWDVDFGDGLPDFQDGGVVGPVDAGGDHCVSV